MHAALPSEGAGGDQDRHIMSRSIHPHRQCRSPAPVISPARRRLAGRCENDRIDAADGLAARGAIAIDSLGASSPSDEPLPAARRRPQQGGGNVEITIALAVLPCPTSRGFLPRRLSDAGPIPVAVLAAGPASEILHAGSPQLLYTDGRLLNEVPPPIGQYNFLPHGDCRKAYRTSDIGRASSTTDRHERTGRWEVFGTKRMLECCPLCNAA